MFNIKYKNTEGYLYLVWVREFAKSGQILIKFGYTEEENVFKRIDKYGYGSELITYFYVKNPLDMEKKMIKIFKNMNNNTNIFKYFGKEYFSIKPLIMINEIKKNIGNNIIREMNIDEDIKNKRHLKLSLYYDENINTEIFNYVNDYFYINNYETRVKNFYFNYVKKLYNNIYHDVLLFHNIYYFNNFNKNNFNKNIVADELIEDLKYEFGNELNDELNDKINKINDDVYLNSVPNKFLIKKNEESDDVKEEDVEEDVKEEDVKEEDVKEEDVEEDIKEEDVEEDIKEEDIKEEDIKEEDVKEEDVKEEDVKKEDNKPIYICHHCLAYSSVLKSDMVRHLNRINKCVSNSEYTFDEANKISQCKRFIFNININEINKNDIKLIITKFKNPINYINENWKKLENTTNTEKDNRKKCKVDNNIFKCFDCKKIFSSKQNLIIHSKNKKTCNKNILYNQIMEQHAKNNSS